MSSLVRSAVPEDAAQAVEVLRLSITELCAIDHQNDAATLEQWLANKQVDIFERWLADTENEVVVAARDGMLRGVALLYRLREVRLCYIRPGKSSDSGVLATLARSTNGGATAPRAKSKVCSVCSSATRT